MWNILQVQTAVSPSSTGCAAYSSRNIFGGVLICNYAALALHRYLGVMAGIPTSHNCLTGSLLVFSEELEHFLNPHLLQVAPQGERVSPQLVVDVAHKVHPDLLPHRITVPQTPEQVYTVMMVSPRMNIPMFMLILTAEVLGSRPWKLGGFPIESHVHLFAGDLGCKLSGFVACCSCW